VIEMADTYTGYVNIVQELPEEGIPFEITLGVGLTVLAGIVYSVFMK